MGFRGANFTIPHKVTVIPYLDQLSQAAELMGAVNCVNHVEGRLLGENTDGKGFVQSLRTVADPVGKKVVLLGAGGAARAIGVELALASAAEVLVVNRDPQRGQASAQTLAEKTSAAAAWIPWQGDYEAPSDADIVINATSIGLGDPEARVPLRINTLQAEMVVADVIFNPPQTRLIRDAQQRGCTVLDGLGMLVNQGVIAFQIWTEKEPDAAVMREALEEYLEL